MHKIEYNPNNKRVCSKCKEEKLIIDFKRDKRASQGYGWVCVLCSRQNAREFYNQLSPERKRYYSSKKEIKALRNKIAICLLLSDLSCIDCGESDLRVLDLDHQRDKEIEISALTNSGGALEKIKAEWEKCEIVCSNCHRKRTMQRADHYRQKYLDGKISFKLLAIKEQQEIKLTFPEVFTYRTFSGT